MSNGPRTIFFIGKPGSGKGTQAKLLAEHTGWQIFGAGSQFRQIAEEETPVGRKTKDDIDNGYLMPHWFAMYLYLKSLFSVSETADVIFDGFNRKVEEAELIISSLNWLSRPYTVIAVEISDEEMRKRLSLRKEEEHRADDSSLDTRLEEYYAHTAKAIELFKKEGVLVEINGERSREEIAEDIKTALNV